MPPFHKYYENHSRSKGRQLACAKAQQVTAFVGFGHRMIQVLSSTSANNQPFILQ